ncbi:hypothetical protein [Mesorhizobium sp.]|uniref:hypothetical protein n=1 Tax=Mesorhizobium sp. TaxID=1871066 RepID=UPI00121B07A6|nr:hypothetical protein [Mesorhizobium sp.]TIS62350.1 MAG: hypothetical protein E5W92_31585 [Mesorhizobium sp.]
MIEVRISGTGLRLADVTERHMAAQRAASDALMEWDGRRAAGVVSDVAYAIAVSAVATEEATARREVMEYQPVDYEESIGKLVYITAFLIATRLRLEDGEMVRVMETAAPFDGTG